MSKYVLVFFDDNYADEFDVSGHKVLEKEKWEKHLAEVKEFLDRKVAEYPAKCKYDYYTHEVYFGTNEMMTYSSYKDYESAFKTKALTEEEVAILTRLGLDEGGTFLTIEPEDC